MRHKPIIATPEEWKESEPFRFKCFALGNLCNILAMKPRKDARQIELLAEAAALARELFPPMAQSLDWSVEPDIGEHGTTVISQPFLGRWYRVREFTSTPGDLRFNCSFCNNHNTDSIQWCASLEEAKAFCESHHQARFKELLA